MVMLLLIFSNYLFADSKNAAQLKVEFNVALEALNTRNFKKAEKMFSKLAQNEDPRSQFIYAWLLIKKNKKRSMVFFERAHNSGCIGASGVLAWQDMLKNNRTKIARTSYVPTLLRKTALQGDINSQFFYATHLYYKDEYIDSYAWFFVIENLDVRLYAPLIRATKKMKNHLLHLLSRSDVRLAKKRGAILMKKYMKRDQRVCQQSQYINRDGIDIIQEYLAKIH